VSKSAARNTYTGEKKHIDKVTRNIPEIEGALDYLIRVGVKDTSSTRSEKSKSSDSRSTKSTPIKKGKDIQTDKETLSIESIKVLDENTNKRSDTYSF